MSEREKKKIIRDMTAMVLARQPRSCNFMQWKDLKIIYKRWAPASQPLVCVCLSGLNDPHLISSQVLILYNLIPLYWSIS